jgi:hypothetical protein
MLLASLGLALLCAAPGPADAGAPEARVGQAALSAALPEYPHMSEPPVAVGNTLVANDMPMNVQSFMTADPPEKVLAFYQDYFDAKELPSVGNANLQPHFPYPSLTVVNPMEGVEYHVICIARGDGQTMVLMALSDLKGFEQNRDKAQQAKFGPLPPYPRGERPSFLEERTEARLEDNVSFVTADPPDGVAHFYVDALGKQGFKLAASDQSGSSTDLVLARAGESWHLAIIQDTAQQPAATRVMGTLVTPRHPLEGAPR